jgi:hypothetical protein
MGDATQAYASHSPYNNPGVPFPDDDWSYGYRGANPVEYAHRRWIVVHDGTTPPYFILLDDIRKDGGTHVYDWRMHTELTHAIEAAPQLVRLTATNGATLDIDVLAATGATPSFRTETFANPSSDPDTRVLVLAQTTDRARFPLVLRPAEPGTVAPVVTRSADIWGGAETIAWPSGPVDVVIANAGRDTARVVDAPACIVTDARLAQIRFTGNAVARAVLADVTTCDVGAIPLVRGGAQPFSLVLDGSVVHVDRADAVFTLYAPLATAVRVEGSPVPFTRAGNFVSRGPGTPNRTPATLGMVTYPVPFVAGISIALDSPGSASANATVYDVRGARVREVWNGRLINGRTIVAWDGNDDQGRPVAAGVYFVRATAGSHSAVQKIVRLH